MPVQKAGTEKHVIHYLQLYSAGWARESMGLCKSETFVSNELGDFFPD